MQQRVWHSCRLPVVLQRKAGILHGQCLSVFLDHLGGGTELRLSLQLAAAQQLQHCRLGWVYKEGKIDRANAVEVNKKAYAYEVLT